MNLQTMTVLGHAIHAKHGKPIVQIQNMFGRAMRPEQFAMNASCLIVDRAKTVRQPVNAFQGAVPAAVLHQRAIPA